MGWKNLARASGALGLLLVSLFALTARAEDEDLPAVHTLGCSGACANSTPPVPDFHPVPRFPEENLDWYGDYVEGYVLLHYTIQPDGHVSDITQLELVGPKNFADSALRTVRDWTYKPATLEGKPVAVCRTLLVNFRVRSAQVGARDDIARLYHRAVSQIKDSKLQDATETLESARVVPKLNFYERGMLANLSGMVALQKGDALEARRLSQLATDHGLDELPASVARNLWETRIKASLVLGDMVDALYSLARLKSTAGFDPTSPFVKVVDDARAKVDALTVFGTSEKIPESADKGEGVYLALYRRNFAFAKVSGSLDRFTLSCKQQAVESKITTGAEWHVPKSWSECRILVRGAPGTTFQVAQATE
jgi:TonB family protein